MMFRPAKTANHAIWQMGHLANSVRGMVTTCDPSVAFPFEDDTRFGKSKASFDDAAFFPKKAELLSRFDQAMDIAAASGGKAQRRDFAKPTPERMQRFAPDGRQRRGPAGVSSVHGASRPVPGHTPSSWASRI